MNKKGGEKWLSIWWFFVLAVIGGAIVLGVLIYYSAYVDTREVESDILGEKLVRCFIAEGYLRKDFNDATFDVFEKCGIKKEVFQQGSNFYFKINVYDSNGAILRQEIREGSYSFDAECQLAQSVEAKNFPRCLQKEESALYSAENGEILEAKLVVLAASNQELKKTDVV